MIEVSELTKRYGEHTAVDDLSLAVKPGVVTGFLGPNGAGKSTTVRMILGLDRPTAGSRAGELAPFGTTCERSLPPPASRLPAHRDARRAGERS